MTKNIASENNLALAFIFVFKHLQKVFQLVKSRAVARFGQQHVSLSSTPKKVKSLNSSTSWLVATNVYLSSLIQIYFKSHLLFLPECRILKNSNQISKSLSIYLCKYFFLLVKKSVSKQKCSKRRRKYEYICKECKYIFVILNG